MSNLLTEARAFLAYYADRPAEFRNPVCDDAERHLRAFLDQLVQVQQERDRFKAEAELRAEQMNRKGPFLCADHRDKFVGRCAACEKEAIESQLAQLRAERAWQPITDEHRSSERVQWFLLGWFELPGMNSQKVGFWHSRENAWCDTHEVLHNQQSPPTHCIPLPDPPRTPEGAKA